MHRSVGWLLVSSLLLLAAVTCGGCTVFSYAKDGVLLFGNNEDYDRLVPTLWFLPARGPFHGVLCLGFDGRSMQGGMNDAGLCYDATGSTSTLLNWHKEKPEAPPNWLTLVLQQCATVDEVETFVRRYDYSSKGMAQFLWLDRNGDSLIVTSTADGEVAFLRQSGGYRVITNFNVTDPSYGTYPCWRYETAELMLQRIEDGSLSPTVDIFRSTLSGVHFPGHTAYSNVFDLETLTAYVYRACNFRDVRVIDLEAVLATGPPPPMTLEAYFEATADAS
jgi:choloylglycine hydrolase